MAVEKGNKVHVHYKGTLDDGTVFDSSEGKDPLAFEAGAGQVIKGFDEAIVGMNEKDTKKIHLEVDQAYGPRRDELIQKVPKEKIPEGVEKGATLGVTLPTGQQVPAQVVDIDEKEATIDLNHPLAGKALNFELTVDKIE